MMSILIDPMDYLEISADSCRGSDSPYNTRAYIRTSYSICAPLSISRRRCLGQSRWIMRDPIAVLIYEDDLYRTVVSLIYL